MPPLPREHGTWAWLLVPLAVGAGVAGDASLPVALLVMSAVSAFLARMPAELALRREAHRVAHSIWAVLLGALAVGGIVALLAYFERWWLLPMGVAVVAGPAAVVSFRALRLRCRAIGELLVVACLSALAPAAHYAAEGSLTATGLALWLFSALYGGSSVLYVRMLLSDRAQSGDAGGPVSGAPVVGYHVALAAIVALIVAAGGAPPLVVVAFAPLLAKVAYRLVRPPDHLDFQKTGLFEASQAALFAVLLVVAYQIG